MSALHNKILFGRRVLLDRTKHTHYDRISEVTENMEMYMVPFTFDNNGYNYLHEPNHNLSFEEKNYKDNIVDNIKGALDKHNMLLVNISFSTMNLVVGLK